MALTDAEKRMIGGSDAAALVGLHPYKNALSVWRRIVEGHETPETAPMRRGTLLEPVIREMYRLETGATLKGPVLHRHPKLDFVRASLDDVAVRDGVERVVEYKSASIYVASQWGHDGDDVPTHHLAQCQWYEACARLPLCDLVVLIGGDELRTFELRADLEFQSLLFEAAERFWVDHVLTKTPPPLDGTDATSEWLAERYPRNGGSFVEADVAAEHWAARLRVARNALEEAEAQEKEARNHLVAAIGEADGIEGSSWRITHKLVKGRSKTDWEAIAKEAGVPQSLVEKHTGSGAGYRRFLPKFSQEK